MNRPYFSGYEVLYHLKPWLKKSKTEIENLSTNKEKKQIDLVSISVQTNKNKQNNYMNKIKMKINTKQNDINRGVI